MEVLKKIGWWTYAVLATILTLGVFPRFHWVTIQKRKTGGMRAGAFGCVYLYVKADERFPGTFDLRVKGMLTEQVFPLEKIAYVEREPGKLRIESSGGRVGTVQSWNTRPLVEYVTAHSLGYWRSQREGTGRS